MNGSLAKGALVTLATVAELVFGFLTGLLLLSLVPGDGVHANVLGALVLAAVTGGAFFAARTYRIRHA